MKNIEGKEERRSPKLIAGITNLERIPALLIKDDTNTPIVLFLLFYLNVKIIIQYFFGITYLHNFH